MFSIVVTAYNNVAYLPGCLDSVRAQTIASWECVVVDDASPDDTGKVAARYADADERFRVLSLSENRGLHLARRAGVEQCRGEYVIFLDADDELSPSALEDLVSAMGESRPDMVHFGIEVVSSGVSEADCKAFAANVNRPLEAVSGDELCHLVFDGDGGYVQDWRVTQRAYRTELAREAFLAMTDERLERAEDCYEFLVLADHAHEQVTVNDVRALRYFYGRGVTGTSLVGADVFARFCEQFRACVDAMRDYASSRSDASVDARVKGATEKLLDLLMNDWLRRVGDDEKSAAAQEAVKAFGAGVIAAQIMRLVRDAAYDALSTGRSLGEAGPLSLWFHIAECLADEAESLPESYGSLRADARTHLYDLEEYAPALPVEVDVIHPASERDYAAQPIRIFVTTHKEVNRFHSDILQPVQVGFARPRKRFPWALQDDAGENISDRNAMYCELTTQYWAWKNVDAEYYGFCHYRRYFDFTSDWHEENPYGEVMDNFIDWDSQKRYGLDDKTMASVIEGCDVITTGVNDMSAFPEHYSDPLDHYARAPHLRLIDLTHTMDLVCEMQPDYAEDVATFLSGHRACFCNMFIMRKELFCRYCSWMFPILERFMEWWDPSTYSREGLRTPGHLSERLLNIFLIHERRVNPSLCWKELQCVHFEHPEPRAKTALPPADGAGMPVVPVVLAADNNYVPMLTTTILSMLENASSERFFDVVIFEKDISPRNQDLMHRFFSRFANARLRFVNVGELLGGRVLHTNNPHISAETYYRFLIQEVLPAYEKVLYLDSDLIVCGDVAELYDTDLGENLIAAAIDVDYLGNLNMLDGERLRYTDEVLGLKDPYSYFQAGVLLLNTHGLRELHTLEEWLALAEDNRYIYNDQDILNAECQGRVTYLDNAWNVMNDCGGRIAKVFCYAPADVYEGYLRAYASPRIVHYAGFEKPWKFGMCDLSELYWEYARRTPFYEKLVAMASDRPLPPPPPAPVMEPPAPPLPERAVGERSILRVLDPLVPMGSRRREVLKSLGRAARGRS